MREYVKNVSSLTQRTPTKVEWKLEEEESIHEREEAQ